MKGILYLRVLEICSLVQRLKEKGTGWKERKIPHNGSKRKRNFTIPSEPHGEIQRGVGREDGRIQGNNNERRETLGKMARKFHLITSSDLVQCKAQCDIEG